MFLISVFIITLTPSLWQPLTILLSIKFLLFRNVTHIIGLIQYATFLYWILSLSNTYLSFPAPFYSLKANFFLMLSNIPCSVYWLHSLSIYGLQDILLAINFKEEGGESCYNYPYIDTRFLVYLDKLQGT